MDLTPSDYKLLSKKFLIKNGIDPLNWESWRKTGVSDVQNQDASPNQNNENIEQPQGDSINSLLSDQQAVSIAKKLSLNNDELNDVIGKLEGIGITFDTLSKAAETFKAHGDVDSVIGGEADVMNEMANKGTGRKIALWIAAVILAMTMTGCRVQGGFSFHPRGGSGAYCPSRH